MAKIRTIDSFTQTNNSSTKMIINATVQSAKPEGRGTVQLDFVFRTNCAFRACASQQHKTLLHVYYIIYNRPGVRAERAKSQSYK